MDSHCYVRNGIVYIPTQGMMDKGFYLDVEPVAVVPLSETKALHHAFAETIVRGNPKVPIPRPPNYPPPVILKYAGVKSWRSFARGTSTWSLGERDGVFRIHGYRKDGGGWVPDQTTRETFPLGTTADQVIERMIAILQSAAAQQQSS
jgi:hypothetical protein